MEKEKKPLILPKIRKDLTYSFADYDTDGKPQWMIYDPARNKFFIIGWVEYQLLEHWNLNDADKIIETINHDTTLQIEESDVENFIQFLTQNYLIKQSSSAINKLGKDQGLFRKESLVHWLISNYLFFRIPLWHPDSFLVRTRAIGSFIFHRYLGYVMLVLGFVALYQISTRWDTFTHTFSNIFTVEGVIAYFIGFTICKFFHEMGHAYRCRQYNIPVPTLGLAFLVFWPVLYTDTTLSWVLNSKQRLQIALAGIWAETYVTIIAALLWCNVDNTTIQTVCYMIITVNWIGSLLINVSPFMRFDGYYVLADLIKMPNLQPRAFALTRWQIRKWLFGWKDPAPEIYSRRKATFLIVYSLITWLYRLTLYVGIAVLVYHFTVKIVGILLFFIEVYYFILGPVVKEIHVWYLQRARFTWNKNTILTTSIAVLLVSFVFLPIKKTVKLPGTLSYTHEFLIAADGGILRTELPKTGTPVHKGQVIAELESGDLENDMKLIYLEHQKKLNELRNAKINKEDFNQKNVLTSELEKDKAEYEKNYALYSKLTLKAPFDGIVSDVALDLAPGMYVMKDEWLLDIINPNSLKIEAYIQESKLNLIRLGSTGYFYPHSLSDKKIAVKVIAIDSL
ncbi:MAG TPA: efflux RND transporter periplasmic adaptor subunit, partial [Gammaproteobacteria bacterium]|nr:efflux RND transporter periplasmic adaptor subunit [Gammaproteobacteria bacterium]